MLAAGSTFRVVTNVAEHMGVRLADPDAGVPGELVQGGRWLHAGLSGCRGC